jgi:hypothetical protein
MDQLEQEIERATKHASDRLAHGPRAVAARYDADRGLIVIDLSTRYSVSFAPERAQGLAHASPAELAEIEITPSGYGLHFPRLDADLWMPALLEGVFGSRAFMAAHLGAQGGKATSEAKAQAARINGARGGRPAKRAAKKVVPKHGPAKRATAKKKMAKRGVKGTKGVMKPAERRAALRAARAKASAKRKPAKRRA